MKNTVLIFSLGIILNDVTSQTLDAIISSQEPVKIPNTSSTTNSKWDELMPALKMIKNTSNIKKDKLLNVVKIIKFLLTEDEENNQTQKVIEEEKPVDDIPILIMPDIDSLVEERLKSITDVVDDRNYMLDEPEVKNETCTAKNKTADLGRILSKITTALSKLKEQNITTEIQTPTMVPIFRPTGKCQNDFDGTRQLRSSKQSGMNSKSSLSTFSIPCQRASDILEETANFPLPLEAFCDNPAVNLKSLAKNAKVNLDNLPFKNIVPNSVSCVDSDDSIAILFKPKTISLTQCYGNLLKKITLTVLVPYYVSKLAL